MSRLCLKNLPVHANREDVFNYLKRFGKLSELKIITSETYSYGFAQFPSEQDARFVLDTFRDRLFLGHPTVIELARPLRKDMPSTSRDTARSPRYGVQPKYYSSQAHQRRYPVLVDNIPRHICWQELKDFGRLAGGHVAYCNLDRDRKGCGFIEYLSLEDAEEAIRKLNGQKLGGRAVGVSAHSRPPRRRSRSRSPIRRVSETPSKTREEPHSCAFPTSASRYSLRQSPERLASPDRFTSPLYSDDRAMPVVLHPDLYTFSKAVESYRTGLFHETTVAQGSASMLQTSSSFNSSESDRRPVTAPGLTDNYYDFDAYLRLSYNHRLHACYS